MKCLNYPLSLLPSQFLEMRSRIRYGLETARFADTFCNAVLMLLNMSILPLTASFISVQLLYHICHFMFNCCWNVTRSAVVTMSVHNSAAAAAVFRRLSSVSTRDVA